MIGRSQNFFCSRRNSTNSNKTLAFPITPAPLDALPHYQLSGTWARCGPIERLQDGTGDVFGNAFVARSRQMHPIKAEGRILQIHDPLPSADVHNPRMVAKLLLEHSAHRLLLSYMIVRYV